MTIPLQHILKRLFCSFRKLIDGTADRVQIIDGGFCEDVLGGNLRETCLQPHYSFDITQS